MPLEHTVSDIRLVACCTAAPWYIATPLVSDILGNDEYKRVVLDRTPMLRVGETDEVSGVVAFLVSKCAQLNNRGPAANPPLLSQTQVE